MDVFRWIGARDFPPGTPGDLRWAWVTVALSALVVVGYALIAFNRFDTTLVVNIDGLDNQRTRAYFQAAAERLEAEGIPFTQHWGKVNAYTPERVKRAYGANADRWVAARKRILPDVQDRSLFENDYLRGLGLAG